MRKGKFTSATVIDGIYILTEEKNFVQPKFWGNYEETETPACIALVLGDRALLVALNDLKKEAVALLPASSIQTGKEHENFSSALQDFNGLENTQDLSSAGSTIASEVLQTTLLGHPCHITTLGEWESLYKEKALLNGALVLVGTDPIKDKWFLTSTRRKGKRNYFFNWINGYRNGYNQYYDGFVRCVAAVSLKTL